MNDSGEVDICWQGEACGEVGTVGNCEVIPEVIRIEWGWGWCSWNPCIPVTSDITIVGSEGPVWMACAQLVPYTLLSKIILWKGGGRSNNIRGRAGGGEDDKRHTPSGRGGRSSLQNVGFSQLKIDLRFSFISKDVVNWCRSSWYGCVDMEWLWLEQDVIVGRLGVYLLVNNNGGCGCGCVSWSHSVEPFGKNDGGGKADGTGNEYRG